MHVNVRAYLSPTLVLLAFDWQEAALHDDFLGFAIRRTPGFLSSDGKTREASSWLPNRLTFSGPTPAGMADAPSNKAPIQKFMWWDARIEEPDRGHAFVYDVFPVTGFPNRLTLLTASVGQCTAALPGHIQNDIGTWFNRAVVSSQAFSRKLSALGISQNKTPSPEDALNLRAWLANDLQQTFEIALRDASRAVSAVYHLTDTLWAIPAFHRFGTGNGRDALAIVYDAHTIARQDGPPQPSPNQIAVNALSAVARLAPRDKTHIMHDKFIVSDTPTDRATPGQVLTGSANFTTEGLTEQANVLHLFHSAELALIYNNRAAKLAENPSIAETAKLSNGWSEEIKVGTARVRVSFSPEPSTQRSQIDTIVQAIKQAKHSVLFCLFMPTDAALRDACFKAGDAGLMMFGLVNHISPASAASAKSAQDAGKVVQTSALANLALFHRSQQQRDVIDAQYFSPTTVPSGFMPEMRLFPGEKAPDYAPVIIHHKFVIIDAEGADPIVYTGSANMSQNSEHFNDENLLEIRDAHIASIYLAEFFRLYEHYRARALIIKGQSNHQPSPKLALQTNGDWCKKYFVAGSPEAKARSALSGNASQV
jgi:phosphatidylserine/phosphatidylglycerophosphate/cardiolipin synthase-like enzyme